VLLTTGQVTVVASNIYDARTWINPRSLSQSFGVISSSTMYATGASALYAGFSFSAATTITLGQLPYGIPVTLFAQNTGAGAFTLKLAGTTPSGATYFISAKQSGVSATTWTNMVTTGLSFTAGQIWVFSGASLPGSLIYLTYS
jgi:hypothetical protein